MVMGGWFLLILVTIYLERIRSIGIEKQQTPV